MIQLFTGGNQQVRDKLNEIVSAVNMLMNMQGDKNIRITKTQGTGVKIEYVGNQIIPPTGTDQVRVVQVKKDGGAGGSDGVFATWTYSIWDAEADIAVDDPIATTVGIQDDPGRLIAVEYDFAADGTFAIARFHHDHWVLMVIPSEHAKGSNCD